MANHFLDDLTKGQRLVTYSILIFIFSFLVLLFAPVLSIGPDVRMAGWLYVAGVVLAALGTIVGTYLLARGLGHSRPAGVTLTLLLGVPMVNILVLAVLVVRANRALKAGGYKLTFLGASRASAPAPTLGQ